MMPFSKSVKNEIFVFKGKNRDKRAPKIKSKGVGE